MSNGFLHTLRDEALRIEVGPEAVSDLAVENLDLSTSTLSRAVRQSVIARRAEPNAGELRRRDGLSHNRLLMHEVRLPSLRRPAPMSCAA